MFKRTNVKILGIIENMTSFTSDDGIEHFIFGQNGAKKICDDLGIDLLEKINIKIEIREGADCGRPYAEFYNNDIVEKFKNIAIKIIDKLKCT